MFRPILTMNTHVGFDDMGLSLTPENALSFLNAANGFLWEYGIEKFPEVVTYGFVTEDPNVNGRRPVRFEAKYRLVEER
ncbi:hypothetical protein [Saccharopolyspora pogona]|uniref:hypothetical protein n=1 Tax=Saccharopolyspora pogona TaxID=333966 RepID=UPI001682CCD2|nr:hypothetical protein [Saccharopolyspora pogona]